ncbi:MAG: hypothetical protein ACM3ZU_03685 [Bacteroidota bacterium]
MEEQEVQKPVDAGIVPHPLLGSLQHFGDVDSLCIAVEFECDDCCKKALNARILRVIDEFLILVGFEEASIVVKTISGGQLVERELVRAIVIPLDRVCSIEIGAVQI